MALVGPAAFGLAWAASRKAAATGGPIRVGVLNSMSGSLAAYGREGQPAFEYVVKSINNAGGIKSKGGAPIELVFADDESQPAKAASEARRLVQQEGATVLVGSLQSVQMIALAPVLKELKTPALSVWGGGAESDRIFSLGYPYDRGTAQNIHDLLVFLRDEAKFPLNTVAMVYSDYEGGQQVNRFLPKRLTDSGLQIVGEIPLDVRATNHGAAIEKLRALKPDAVAGLITPRNGILLQRARYEAAYHDCIFCSGLGYSDQSMWNELGSEVARAVLTSNVFGMTAFSPGAKIPAMHAIAQELQQVGKIEHVGQGAIQFAQAARVLQRVLEATASLAPDDLIDALNRVEIPFGDPDLYLAKPRGLRFADDRLLSDGSAMFVQWTADRSQQAVFPKIAAETMPVRRS
ncbi:MULTISPECIES: ABC transporter substrate-binding protein [unclassified Bradyrhizobium]|uniref:ABC transporter substrate-binding protein n=1 Tax=unclassified Bradyrhizobium TaxID=2631580 RepID=UPI00230555C7|nr:MULTISPECIES: ABC transporter substrate-binding protein [unclassified Bradyrhizobium]